MAQLIVRNIDEVIVRRLKSRAVEHGRSAEAEHREILRAALLHQDTEISIKTQLSQMPDVGEDDDFQRIPDPGRVIEL